jgi:hypothetical protein
LAIETRQREANAAAKSRVGEASNWRHVIGLSPTLWMFACAAAVAIICMLTQRYAARLGAYRTGIITVAAFALTALYSARKHALWASVRWLRFTSRMPPGIARRLVLLDRLETWRFGHLTLGMLALIPFWWHSHGGVATPLEETLRAAVILLVLSGIVGTVIEEFIPHEMRIKPGREGRLPDVEAKLHALYVEAEESILGHSETLVRAYLHNVRPILVHPRSLLRMFIATMTRADPAVAACRPAIAARAALGDDAPAYRGLVEIAERKVRLEQNQFNLRLTRVWLYFHIALVAITGVLIAFHVMGVLYFVGV